MNEHLNGELKVIGMRGCEEFTAQVDHYLKQLRNTDKTFIVDAQCPRFGSGEGKALINESMRGLDLYIVVKIVVLAHIGKVGLIFLAVLRFARNGDISFGLRVCDLRFICEKELSKEPRCENLAAILFIENTKRRTLRDHLWVACIKLRYCHNLKIKSF